MSNSSRPPGLLNMGLQVRHMIAGMSGGVVSTLLLHPLDLLKIRWEHTLCIFLIPITKTSCLKVCRG